MTDAPQKPLDEQPDPGLAGAGGNPLSPPPPAEKKPKFRTKLHEVIWTLWGFDALDEDALYVLTHFADPDQAEQTPTGFRLRLNSGGAVEWKAPSAQAPEKVTSSGAFSEATAEAMVALARLRGWKTLNFEGSQEQMALLWITLMKQNLLAEEAYNKTPALDQDGKKLPFEPVTCNVTVDEKSPFYQHWLKMKAQYEAQKAAATQKPAAKSNPPKT